MDPAQLIAIAHDAIDVVRQSCDHNFMTIHDLGNLSVFPTDPPICYLETPDPAFLSDNNSVAFDTPATRIVGNYPSW